ncbi:hypothetical protein BsWGS_23721 [Bradybaena similaris]
MESCKVSIQVQSQMACGNIDEKLVKQELTDELCEDMSQRFSKLADRAARSTIHEMAWQSESQDVVENASLTDANCRISDNVSSAIEQNNELFLTNEKNQMQNVGTLLKHTQILANPADYIFGCDGCCSGRIQQEESPKMSDDCVSIASVDGNANRHALPHTEQQDCSCHDCGAGFAELSGLEHLERKHTGEKTYKCDVCEASFTCSNTLIYHKSTHTGEKPYKCDVCEAPFAYSSQLTYHKRKHRGDKSYKCDVCEASFIVSTSLTYHKRIHTVEKTYSCDVCEASFSKSCKLTSHKRTHTGEKPYICDVCDS